LLKDIKNTVKQSAVYGFSRVAAKLVSFILIPVYTAKLSSGAIANINLLESFWQYLFTICMFAFETAIINFCASEENISRRNKILFNFFFMLVINSVVIISIGKFSSGDISEFILNERRFQNVIFYCFLISAFESLLIMPLTIARLNDKPVLYTIISVSNLFINLLLQIYFIVVLSLGFEYVFLAKLLAPALMFIFFIPYILRNFNFRIDKDEIKSILKFSFPLMLAGLLSLLLNTVDRFILSGFVSKEEVAIYTIGYGIGSVANAFILAPFTLAINVIFWKKIKEDNFKRFMTKSSTYLFSTMIFISVIISFSIPYLIKLIVRNESLWPASEIIPFILLSNCFVALFLFPNLDLYYKKKTHVILYIIAVSLAFNVITNFIFIKYFGIFASAVITILSSILMLLLGFFLTKSFSFTKFEVYKVLLLSVLFIIFAGYSFMFTLSNVYLDIIIKLLLLLLFIFLLNILKFFEPIEIERIKGFFNKYIFKKLK
jgi:O-antigen/teichoic acid export membrane protein